MSGREPEVLVTSYSIHSDNEPEYIGARLSGNPRPPMYRISLELMATPEFARRLIEMLDLDAQRAPGGAPELPPARRALPPGPIEGVFIEDEEDAP